MAAAAAMPIRSSLITAESFAAEYERGFTYSLNLFTHMVPRELAYDLAQDAWMRAWQFRSTYRGDSVFRTWFYRIAQNVLWNHFRKREHRCECIVPITPAIESSCIALDPEVAAIESREEWQRVLSAGYYYSRGPSLSEDVANVASYYDQDGFGLKVGGGERSPSTRRLSVMRSRRRLQKHITRVLAC